MADSEMIERMIAEELSQLDPLDLESVSSGDEDVSDGVDDCADDDRDPVNRHTSAGLFPKLVAHVWRTTPGVLDEDSDAGPVSQAPDIIPESLLACLELDRKRMSAVEEVILEDLEKRDSVNTSGSEHYKDILQGIASDLHEDPVQLKERVMSQIEEEELYPRHCMTCPVDVSEGKLTDEDSTYMETEKLFHLELENLAKKLKEEGEKRHEEYRKLKEQLQKAERDEEEKRRSRHRDFQEELKRIEKNSIMQQRNGEDLLQFELCQQEKRIAELQKCMEEERQAFEVAQAQERQRIDQIWYRAATVVQASIRAFLVRKRTRVLLSQKREERMKRQQLRLARERIEREEKLSREMEDQNIREEEERRIRQENEKIKRKVEEQKIRKEEVESRITQENEKVRRRMEDHKITEEEKRIRQENEEKLRREMEDKNTKVEEEENKISQVKEKMRRKMEDQKVREEEEERIRQKNEEELSREMEDQNIREEEERRIRQENEKIKRKEEQKIREEEVESRIRQENEEKLRREMEDKNTKVEGEENKISQMKEKMRRKMEDQKIREEGERIRQENKEKLRREMEEEMIGKKGEERRIRQENEEELSREMEDQNIREEEERRIRQENEKIKRKEEQKIREEEVESRIRQENEEKLRREMEDQNIREKEERRIRQENEKIHRKMEDHKIREEEETIRRENEEKFRRGMEDQNIKVEKENKISQVKEKMRRKMEKQKIREEEERRIRQENEKIKRKEEQKIREEEVENRIRQENEEKLRREMEEQKIREEEVESRIRQENEEKLRREMEERNIREEEKSIRQENEEKLQRRMEDQTIKVKEEENKISQVKEKTRRKMEEQKIGAEEEERRVRQEKEQNERVGNLRRNLEEKVSEESRTTQEKEYSTRQEKFSRSLKEPEKVEKNWRLRQEQVQPNKDVRRMDKKGQQERDELEANPRTESRCVAQGGRKQNDITEDALRRRIRRVLQRSTDETQEVGDRVPVEELVALDSCEIGGPQCYGEMKHFHNTFLNERNQAEGVKHSGKSDSPLLGLEDQEGPRESQWSSSPHSVRASCSIGPEKECLAAESTGVTGGTEAMCGITSWCAKPPSSGEPTAAGSVHSSTWGHSCLPDGTEQKRLGWMKTCTPWFRLATWNKRKAPADRKVVRRGPVSRLPPLSVDAILGPGAWTSLTQVTTVTLEDLPGCSLSTLSECAKLQALTLRRCGLEALEGISKCKDLKYIDVQENAIKFVNCENLENLRVLLLSRNQLTSIHGLESAMNLDVLELSHNRISRIGGLKSFKRLQKLLIDHNQLISTRGLGEVYTLLHLDCANNHLTSLEDIDSCALLSTLKLQGNNLMEAPCLSSHVLMKELCLDDNCTTSLDTLSISWLPMLRRISVSQNSLTELPSLSDCVSLQSLDISHNCLSDLLNVQKSLNGCLRLQEICLTGNPFQKETTWRSALLEMVPSLWKIDGESIGPPPARGTDGGGDPWPSSFLAFCQAQFVQVDRTNRKHMSELCACSPADVPSTIIRHSDELLLLAIEHHHAHEYGDFSFTDKAEGEVHGTLGTESNHRWHQEDIPSSCLVKDNVQGPEVLSQRHSNLVQLKQVQETSKNECQDKSSQEDLQCSANTMGEKRESDNPDTVDSFCVSASQCHTESRGKNLIPARKVPRPDLKLNLKHMAAVVIQSYWRGYRCRKTIPPKVHVSRRDSVCTEAVCAARATVDQEWAATVIQAVWKGYVLRKRLSVALALAQINEPEEDFDEVDVDEFTFDEAALEEGWVNLDPKHLESTTLPFSQQLLQTKSLMNKSTPVKGGASVPLQMPKQAWPSSEAEKMPCWSSSTSIRSYGGSSRTHSNSGVSALSEKAEKILQDWGFTDSRTAHLILKRAQKMRSERNRKLLDPAARLALFKSNKNKLTPIKTPKKASPEKTDYFKALPPEREAPQAATEDPRWASRAWANEWLHKQAADASSQSNHFLPEIDPDVLNGKKVQLVAASGYKDELHQEGGSRTSATTLSVPRREHCLARRHSAGPARKEAPAPGGLNSCPPKNERISFRDNPVRLSAGWGSGKKRSRPGK